MRQEGKRTDRVPNPGQGNAATQARINLVQLSQGQVGNFYGDELQSELDPRGVVCVCPVSTVMIPRHQILLFAEGGEAL